MFIKKNKHYKDKMFVLTNKYFSNSFTFFSRLQQILMLQIWDVTSLSFLSEVFCLSRLIVLIMQVCSADDLKRSIHLSVMKSAVVVRCINRSSSLKLQLTCSNWRVLLAPACILVGLHKIELRHLTTCEVIVVVTRQS